ncbi:hypothetical protein CR511_18420 [Pseudomonas putida]|nr:hypothetical protein CR511_18420 [Pseudomonas putida]
MHRPLRGQARSHRYATGFKANGVPVGAGLPAKGPVQVITFSELLASPLQQLLAPLRQVHHA